MPGFCLLQGVKVAFIEVGAGHHAEQSPIVFFPSFDGESQSFLVHRALRTEVVAPRFVVVIENLKVAIRELYSVF